MGWFRRKPENRQSSYTDLIVDHVVARASGSAGAKPTGTGTLEAAAGCYGRAFASATVVGGGMAAAALTPEILMLVGRELTRSGEVLLVIDVDQGDVRLIPAVSFDVEGDYRPSAWRYRCELPGPHTTTTRTVAADGVVHVRINVAPREPWRGRAPLQVAHLAGRLDAELAGALGDEAAGPRGSLLPLPVDGEDPSVEKLRADIRGLGGALATVESTSSSWEGTPDGSPRGDWTPRRLGAAWPGSMIDAGTLSARSVASACGVPLELIVEAGDGTAAREAWRRFLFGSVVAHAAIARDEFRRKLDPGIDLDFAELRASDLAGRARAFQSMVGGGMELDKAAALSGLVTDE